MDSSEECTVRETARTIFLFLYSYRSQYGGQR